MTDPDIEAAVDRIDKRLSTLASKADLNDSSNRTIEHLTLQLKDTNRQMLAYVAWVAAIAGLGGALVSAAFFITR